MALPDGDRYRLIHGPYAPPPTYRGDFLTCEIQGLVKVGGYTDAPIPWPKQFRRGGKPVLIVCGDLIAALKTESVLAIHHHWHVGTTTISRWKRRLKIHDFSEGSSALMNRANKHWAEPDHYKKLVDAGHTESATRKNSDARKNKALTPEHRAAISQAQKGKPKSQEWKKRAGVWLNKRWHKS